MRQTLLFKVVAEAIGAKVIGNPQNMEISNVLIDTRTIIDPKNGVFVALKGPNRDGHRYIGEARSRGVKCFIVSDMQIVGAVDPDEIFAVVADTQAALQTIGTVFRFNYHGTVIGITGSNGKTIVKEWLFRILNHFANTYRSPQSYNSQIGVPLSLSYIDESASYAIIEAGISKPGEMERLFAMVQPEIGIITNIMAAHQENFESYTHKACEKLKLFAQSKVLIYPLDNTYMVEALKQMPLAGCEKVSWGYSNAADLQIVSIENPEVFTLVETSFRGGEPVKYKIPFTDKGSLENVFGCLALTSFLRLDVEKVAQVVAQLEPVAMRLELKEGINNCLIIDDSYNADPASLELALGLLHQQAKAAAKKEVLILSDVSGLSLENNGIAGIINAHKPNRIICIGSVLSEMTPLLPQGTLFYNDTLDFLDAFSEADYRNEVILIKGSRRFRFEQIVARFEARRNNTILEVNLDTLLQNLQYLRSLLRPGTKIMAMVKAFAYGSGVFEVSRLFQRYGVDYLAVAVADEGVELRRAGITMPIVVMTPQVAGFDLMVNHRLEPGIYSLEELYAFNEATLAYGQTNYPVHLKLDTGMHRLGFESYQIDDLCDAITHCSGLRISSVFSHLAAADEADKDAFTMNQIARFDNMVQAISACVGYLPDRHILNSAGIERFAAHQYEMVRPGIALYGISAVADKGLQPIGCWKTTITQIRNVPATETVGYGRKGLLMRDSVIATLPVGYADGLHRKMGNRRGGVWVNGQLAPFVGNICMDLCMIDITGIEVEVGNEVEIFGPNISLYDVANQMETITYEVLTGISQRVKRVYVKG